MLKKLPVIALALLGLGVPSIQDSYASEKLFTQLSCNKCHSITSAGIKKAAEEEDEEDGESAGPPDLSGIGAVHDAAYITSFLKKEVESTARPGVKGGQKHRIKFKGTDTEMTELVSWLVSLKK